MIGMGSSSSRQSFPSWTAPFSRFAWTGAAPGGPGHTPAPEGGLIGDYWQGQQAMPSDQAFAGLGGYIPAAQQAGGMAQQLGAGATQQGYDNLMALGAQGWGPLQQMQGMAGLAPQGMDASNYFLNHGVTPAVQGGNVQGAMGAGQQVVDASLKTAQQLPGEAYQRVVADALPEVRSSYSARGLGSSGEAARGEQDYIARTRDNLFQQDVANQVAALGTGASASGAAASQAIGAQNAAIGRGQLGYQAAHAPGDILSQFQGIAGAPLDAMQQFAGLQGAPLGLVGQGLDLYNQGLSLPLQYQQQLYNFTRSPGLDMLGAMSGTQQGNQRGWNFSLGGGNKGGGGSGGGGGN